MGGLENGVVNLINRLPAERWRHAIVALTDIDAGFASRIQRTDVQLLALHKPPGQGLWQFPKLYRLFRDLKPAIVHTRNLGALEAQVPAWAAGVPGRVHGEHGRDADDVDGTNRRHIWMRRVYRHFVHQHIALGGELAGYLRTKIGVPESQLTAIYNGVDHHRFSPATQRQPIPGCPFTDPALWLAGTVGRMQTVKAQPLLAQAFVNALQQQPALRDTLRLVMVGDGPLRAECQAILQQAGVAHLAWLPGARDDVPDVMRGLDCFVLPSLAEGISNTILEAMACGLPVLATRVGASAELVETGRTGWVVSPGQVSEMTEALLKLATNRNLAMAMGQEARLDIERRFSLKSMVDAYTALYGRVLQ
ncbi:sugar transferase [beta proteobacterium AAP51]|nr:sugar transferase [beta proteobacterium AAP51]